MVFVGACFGGFCFWCFLVLVFLVVAGVFSLWYYLFIRARKH